MGDKRKIFVLFLVGLIGVLFFSSVSITAATHDQCETDPSQCQCSFNTCLGGCLNIDPLTVAGCAASCGTCFTTPNIWTCGVCAACLSVGVTALVNCIGTCQGDPCAYGYVCRPCEIKSPINRRCYDSDTYEFEICRCDGQGWDNWKRIDCPPENPICEDGECVPEASTLVLFAVGLLSLAGYLRLRRKEN